MSPPIVHHPSYTVPLPHRHRFPMNKYRALIELLREDGLAPPDVVHEPAQAPRQWLEMGHDPGYVEQICERTAPPEMARRIGLPLSAELVRRSRVSTAGSVLAGRLALERGLACQTAGGSHHAGRLSGAGYCVFNDVAVACRVLQHFGLAERILVIDLDVHQGDGTADIFQGDDAVFTFSMHCEKNFPVRKQTSDLDVGLPVGTGDRAYLEILAYHLDHLVQRGRFDLVFYNAGVDPHADDRLGRLSLSDRGLADRDEMVISACLDAQIPLACVIGGGYDNDVFALARRHALLHRASQRLFGGFA